MRGKEFLERLETEILIGDGAMGTMLHSKGIPWEANFDSLNLTRPGLVKSIHSAYLKAGAQFIETNTFGANRNKLSTTAHAGKVREINLKGAAIAREVAGKHAFVAGSVGPLGVPRGGRIPPEGQAPAEVAAFQTPEEKYQIFQEQLEALAQGGVDCLIIESFPTYEDLSIALRAARECCGLPVICQLAILEGGPAGEMEIVTKLLKLAGEGAAIIGGNCGSGPAYLLKVMDRLKNLTNHKLSAFPNTSFPQYLDGRFVFLSEPRYFVESALDLAKMGVNLLGGCCGTTPQHISLLTAALKERKPAPRTIITPPIEVKRAEVPLTPPVPPAKSFLSKLGKKPLLLVELDPPKGSGYERVLEGAGLLASVGVDAISIAENPLASIRMSPSALGYLIQKEAGLIAIPHCTCRDRNLLGQQSELMGAWALGINTVLVITGDPTSIGAALGTTPVFDTNSFGLVEMIVKLNEGKNILGHAIAHPTSFTIGVAFNPNRTYMDQEVSRLEKKVSLGAHFALSQLIYDKQRIREMYEKTAYLKIPVLTGIMPLVSAKNADFLHHEVPGIKVPEEMRNRMKEAEAEGAATPEERKRRAIQEGIAISKELIDVALESGAPGIYMVAPFNRYDLMAELCQYVMKTDAVRVNPGTSP